MFFCLNELNFSILSRNFHSDSISKQKQVTTLCFDSISKLNVAFYSGLYVRERKTILQRSIFQLTYGRRTKRSLFYDRKQKNKLFSITKKRNVDITICKRQFVKLSKSSNLFLSRKICKKNCNFLRGDFTKLKYVGGP
jgi:hypothetical protein